MSLHIMERMHSLYERFVHRGAAARQEVPLRPADQAEADAAHDLATLDVDQLAYGEDATPIPVDDEVTIKDGGDLYGVRLPAAADRHQLDNDEAMATGQNWIESLETHAAEGGPEPEQELDILDEEDLVKSSADSKDRPIADRGSAGPRGL